MISSRLARLSLRSAPSTTAKDVDPSHPSSTSGTESPSSPARSAGFGPSFVSPSEEPEITWQANVVFKSQNSGIAWVAHADDGTLIFAEEGESQPTFVLARPHSSPVLYELLEDETPRCAVFISIVTAQKRHVQVTLIASEKRVYHLQYFPLDGQPSKPKPLQLAGLKKGNVSSLATSRRGEQILVGTSSYVQCFMVSGWDTLQPTGQLLCEQSVPSPVTGVALTQFGWFVATKKGQKVQRLVQHPCALMNGECRQKNCKPCNIQRCAHTCAFLVRACVCPCRCACMHALWCAHLCVSSP